MIVSIQDLRPAHPEQVAAWTAAAAKPLAVGRVDSVLVDFTLRVVSILATNHGIRAVVSSTRRRNQKAHREGRAADIGMRIFGVYSRKDVGRWVYYDQEEWAVLWISALKAALSSLPTPGYNSIMRRGLSGRLRTLLAAVEDDHLHLSIDELPEFVEQRIFLPASATEGGLWVGVYDASLKSNDRELLRPRMSLDDFMDEARRRAAALRHLIRQRSVDPSFVVNSVTIVDPKRPRWLLDLERVVQPERNE